jgi:N-formylglutamate deformylase
VSQIQLRHTEDPFVEELYSAVPQHGGVLVNATFPRCYIDPNRSEFDIDEGMLEEPWPVRGVLLPRDPAQLTGGRLRGGLVFRSVQCLGGVEIYDRKLSIAEVQNRLETYWRPYHSAVSSAIESNLATFGRSYHVNCHSCRPYLNAAADQVHPRADMILGDREGTTCSAEFTNFVKAKLEAMGYWVEINDPFKGVELVHRYSEPSVGKHSLQIEINRKLYMTIDDKAITKTDNFDKLQQDMGKLAQAVCKYASEASS